MLTEALLFCGVALFFGGTAVLYGVWAHADPAGTAALVVATLMAALVAFFCAMNYRRRGRRPQDRGDAEVADGAGPLEFFPPSSRWPIVTAAGFVGHQGQDRPQPFGGCEQAVANRLRQR